MRINLLYLILLFLLCSISSIAQRSKFGNVSIEELRDSTHELEPEAKAAILYQSGKVEILYNPAVGRHMMTTEVHRRIKVYNTEGQDWGELRIPIYTGNNSISESITSLKAFTYNLEGEEIIKSKLNNKEVFTEKVSEYLRREKFAMPNVKRGSIIEYKYIVSSPFFYGISKWNFQFDIPCNETIYIIRIPYELKYNERIYGTQFIPRKESKEASGYASGQSVRQVLTFKQKNTPSLKDVPHVLNIDDYRLGISFEAKQSWDQLASDYNQSSRFGGQLRKRIGVYKDFIASIDSLSPKERMEKIYFKVQQEYSWNNTYGEYTDKGINFLIKNKTGNVAEINLLLINLLNQSGIETMPIVTQRRSYGAIDVNFPSFYELDYVFAVARIDGKNVYLDATDKLNKPGTLPNRAINTYGVLIHQTKTQSIADAATKGTPMYIDNQNTDIFNAFVTAAISEENELSVKSSEQYDGKGAKVLRMNLVKNNSEDELIDYFEKKENRLTDEIEIINQKDLLKPLKIKSTFEKEGLLEEVGNKFYINPLLGYEKKSNPHLEEERQFPIYYTAMKNERITINLMIPDGYKIESIPEPVNLSIPEGMGSFYFNYQMTGTMLQIQSMFKINGTGFSPQYHVPLKMLYEKAIELGKQKIVLAKEN